MQIGSNNDDTAAQRPIRLPVIGDQPMLTSETVVAVTALIHRRAVASPTSRLKSDVQPWPIAEMTSINGEVSVWLESDDGRGHQSIQLRLTPEGFEIIEMR